ncbi:MAG: HAD family hydrolase [Deltaproteobacteria bacterium]|nr:HAD family hydrolase [Deltaproteobacteria bacterium]
MTQEPFGYLLFDIDGTLLTAKGSGRKAIENAVSTITCTEWTSSSIRLHGNTDQAVFEEIHNSIRNLLTDDINTDDLRDMYFEKLQNEFESENICIPLSGVPAFLERASSHWNLFLLTGNFRTSAFMKLEKADISRWFTDGGFGDDAFSRTEILDNFIRVRGIEKSRCILIGDTPWDAEAANDCNIPCIGLVSDYFSFHDLESCGFTLVYDCINSITNESLRGLIKK